jgi:hypothetical protein
MLEASPKATSLPRRSLVFMGDDLMGRFERSGP